MSTDHRDHARLNKCILPEIQMCYQAHVLCVKPEQKSSNEHVSGQIYVISHDLASTSLISRPTRTLSARLFRLQSALQTVEQLTQLSAAHTLIVQLPL